MSAPANRLEAAIQSFEREARSAFADAEAFAPNDADEGLDLGALMRKHREALGLSLQEVADRSGFTKSHVWELEQGRSANPSVRAIQGISSALGLPSTMVFRAALRATS